MPDVIPHNQPTSDLPALLSRARQSVGLSLGQLADASGISKTHLFNLEQGAVSKVQPAMLRALAEPLEVSIVDLYAAAGFALPDELPSFTPYLRSKYQALPPKAQAELQQSFARITAKYGYSETGSGPAAGEDE